jgi:hypothetical protein
MFVLDLSDTFFWPVRFRVPKADGTGFDEQTFDAEFKRLPQDEITGMLKRAAEQRLSDSVLAAEILVGWKGVVDKAKAPVAYSESQRNRALQVPGMGSAVMAAFLDAHAQAAAKN